MTQSKTRLLLGNKAKTGLGIQGHAKGMYSGGFDYYIYGLWPFIYITHYVAWGDFCNNNTNLK